MITPQLFFNLSKWIWWNIEIDIFINPFISSNLSPHAFPSSPAQMTLVKPSPFYQKLYQIVLTNALQLSCLCLDEHPHVVALDSPVFRSHRKVRQFWKVKLAQLIQLIDGVIICIWLHLQMNVFLNPGQWTFLKDFRLIKELLAMWLKMYKGQAKLAWVATFLPMAR